MRLIFGYLSFVLLALTMATSSKAEPASYKVAREILGSNFITPSEVMEGLQKKVIYSQESIVTLGPTPSAEELRWLAENNYILMPGPTEALSLLKVRELKPEIFFRNPKLSDVWYARLHEEFAIMDTVKSGWIAIRKSPIPNSINKTWDEQVVMLAENERPPNAAELAWLIVLHTAVRGERLYAGKPYVRLASIDSRGSHVYAFEASIPGTKGFFLSGYWDSARGKVHAITSVWSP